MRMTSFVSVVQNRTSKWLCDSDGSAAMLMFVDDDVKMPTMWVSSCLMRASKRAWCA